MVVISLCENHMFCCFSAACGDNGFGFAMGQPVRLRQMQSGWKVQPEKHGQELPHWADFQTGMLYVVCTFHILI